MKNTLCLMVSAAFFLSACGDDLHTTPGEYSNDSSKDLLHGSQNENLPDRDQQATYPKPMVSAAPANSPAFFSAADSRHNYPGTFAITAPPTDSVRTAAEWENKQALLLAWTGNFADLVASIIKSAKVGTNVTVAYDSNQSLNDFQYQMQSRQVSLSGVTTVQMPVQTLWMRDYGPLTVERDGKIGFVDLRYYPGRLYDDALPQLLSQKWNINNFRMPVDFEGGNFMSDGHGTCYATTAVLSRNPGATESMIRAYFSRYLGCHQLVLLHPLYGEGTGHIDMFAKLADRNTVVLGQYRKSQNDTRRGTIDAVNADILDNNAAILSNVTLADGSGLQVVRMAMPTHSDYNFRTYVNTQFINGVNLVPVYQNDQRFEQEALQQWQSAMPTWQHVPVDATELITWAGAVHCILMEVSSGVRSPFQATPSKICNDFDCFPSMLAANVETPNDPAPTEPEPEPEPEPTQPEPTHDPEPSTPDSSCPSGEIPDCNGTCAPSNWLADGYCDNGAYTHQGAAINFSCSEFSYDRGDCKPAGQTCAASEILDCRNQCAPANWVGDGYCDAGNYVYQTTGQAVYLNCTTHGNDGGDC